MVTRTVARNTTTETEKTPFPKSMIWLVNTPQDKKHCLTLTAACRGNDAIANILDYFLYEAARESRDNMPQEDVEFVEIKRAHKHIHAGLAKFNKSVSEKTLIKRMVKLQSWQFLQCDAHRQTYKVYFRNIQNAMDNPPPSEKAKPRGIHARKLTQQSEEQSEDGKSTISSKSTVSTQKDKKRIVLLEQEVVNLQSQLVNLQSEMVKIQDQMVNLQSSESHERACRAALEAKIEALYNTNILSNIDTNTISFAPTEQNAEPLASSNDFATQQQTSLFENSLFPDLPETQEQQSLKEENAKEKARLELHRAIYNTIVARRGRELAGGKVGMERKAINELIKQGFTVQVVERDFNYLFTEHWRYSQLENKYNISAQTILSEHGAIEAILNDPAYKSKSQQEAKNQPTPTKYGKRYVAPTYQDQDYSPGKLEQAQREKNQRLLREDADIQRRMAELDQALGIA